MVMQIKLLVLLLLVGSIPLQVYVSEFLQKTTFSQSLYPVCSYIFSITRSQRRQLASSHNGIGQ